MNRLFPLLALVACSEVTAPPEPTTIHLDAHATHAEVADDWYQCWYSVTLSVDGPAHAWAEVDHLTVTMDVDGERRFQLLYHGAEYWDPPRIFAGSPREVPRWVYTWPPGTTRTLTYEVWLIDHERRGHHVSAVVPCEA